MFGYVHISPERLNGEEKERYQACYCGLCHTLGERYGAFARMILNYDLVFLAMLLADGEVPACCARRCVLHPIHPRCACRATAALESAADISVLLTWWQLRDGVADHGFWGGLKYRFLSLLLRKAYKKAQETCPEMDKMIQVRLDRLSVLEREKCPVPDEAADAFALLLQDTASLQPFGVKRRGLAQLLYHLGRWIYLVDALDDLKEDGTSGSYNPLLLRYKVENGILCPEDRARVAASLDASIRTMAAAFELADFGCWTGIIESVVYEGLYAVGNAVLNGTFRKNKRNIERQMKGRTQ